jgi:hypothetical protein
MFHATTAGRINGVPFDHNKVEFDGYADPKQSVYLVSNRLASIPLPDGLDLNNPSMDGVYEYELQYKEATEDRFSRRTAKGIHIQQWLPIPSKPAGTQVVIPVRVILRDEIEE